MRIVINKIERDCKILPAPSNSFYIKNEIYGFPLYVIIAPAITKEELEYGDILVCPVVSLDGYESINPMTIDNYLYLFRFKNLVEDYYKEGYFATKKWAAEWLLEDFQNHGVKIDKRIIEYVNNLE